MSNRKTYGDRLPGKVSYKKTKKFSPSYFVWSDLISHEKLYFPKSTKKKEKKRKKKCKDQSFIPNPQEITGLQN